MKEQDQQIALCEWMGWKNESHGWWRDLDGMMTKDRVPNTSSLNVLHEMEKKLTDHTGYIMALKQVTGEYLAPFFLITASAPQRREALLRTLRLWKE